MEKNALDRKIMRFWCSKTLLFYKRQALKEECLYLFSKIHILSQNGGQSIVVLASIQSGYSQDTGARCNEVEGYYTDEEINIQAQGVLSWIRDEVTQLEVIQELR